MEESYAMLKNMMREIFPTLKHKEYIYFRLLVLAETAVTLHCMLMYRAIFIILLRKIKWDDLVKTKTVLQY